MIKKTELNGVLEITPQLYLMTFVVAMLRLITKDYHEAGIDTQFIQDDINITWHVLRGIHGDSKTCKLVMLIWGFLSYCSQQ